MIRKIILINSVVMILLAGLFLLYPSVRAALSIRDPALKQAAVPEAAWRWFRQLTPRYERWARGRVAAGQAAGMSVENISGTEWPPFGSVFYLWAVENLQSAWERGDRREGIEPAQYSRGAVIAASELVIDPNHASWVKKHWGENYMHRENIFYRMLVIAALTTREELLHDHAHLDLLRDQVESLSKELDESGSGLLDDYPGQCYPGDVMAALMCFKRADAILGTDHSKIVARGIRGFTGKNATRHFLPPFAAGSTLGFPVSETRGCANSYMCLTAPELWPAQAKLWYTLYDRFFWQEHFSAAGFREYARDVPHSEWTIDVDAGPVIAGYGISANSFGIGAARKNGRLDRAYPLAAEMLATVWELPNGVLAAPRLLSDLGDAPMVGEAALLWQLSIQPEPGFAVKTGGRIPLYVYILLIGAFLLGTWRVGESLVMFNDARRQPEPGVRARSAQIGLWVTLLVASAAAFATSHVIVGFILLLFVASLPIVKRKKAPKGVEDWHEAAPPPTNPVSK